MADINVTDPGIPSYVDTGYVNLGYQTMTANPFWIPPSPPPQPPPDWIAPPPWATDPTNLPVQGIAFDPPITPTGWPSGPTTLPVTGSPTGASFWSAGPSDLTGQTVGYGPPSERTVDDGIQFPASPNDLILRNEWHGIASTINPGNVALYNLQLRTIIEQAIQGANATSVSSVTILPGGGGSSDTVTLPIAPILQIEAAVQAAIIKSFMQGSNLWYELVLKPVTNGPFAGAYVVNTLSMVLPQTIDLENDSPGGNLP